MPEPGGWVARLRYHPRDGSHDPGDIKDICTRCYCCDCKLTSARKVKLRRWRELDPLQAGPDTAAYQSYCEEMTYRWAVICQACYSILDNESGLAEVAGIPFNLKGESRGDRATTVDEAKYERFRRKQAAKLGMNPDDLP